MLLKRLTEASGISGQENEIRDVLKAELGERNIFFETDAIGNIIAHSQGTGPKVMLAAHMDEVGSMVMGFEKNGLIRFKSIGIDDRILVSKVVRVGSVKIPGVIGAKAIHLQEPEERERPIKVDNLYIDIGATSKEEALKYVKLGDAITFATEYEEIGDGMAKGKAFDDRAGCALLLESMNPRKGLDMWGVFTVQEEIGARGASVAAYSVNPDLAIVLECTSASDVPGTLPHQQSTELGKGPVISFMDSSIVVNPKLFKALTDTAREWGIPFQFKRATVGGTDAGKIHTAREGIPSVVISMPCRYIHAPAGLINLADYDATKRLLTAFLDRIEERGLPL